MFSKPKVFISHSKKDIEFVRKLDSSLRQCQCDTWIDEIEIRHGRPWLDEIFKHGIPSCEIVLCYITESSIDSSMVGKEIDARLIERMQDEQVTILLYISDSNLRKRLRLDLQSLQIPELNLSNYDDMMPKIVAEIWRSHADWSISRAVQSQRVKTLELELRIKELQEAGSSSIFLNSENPDFSHIWSMIDITCPLEVDFRTERDANVLRTLEYTLDYGQLYLEAVVSQTFTYSSYRCDDAIKKAISILQKDDLRGLDLKYKLAFDFEALFLPFGFFRRVTRESRDDGSSVISRFIQQRYDLVFTERFDRFNYWLLINHPRGAEKCLLVPRTEIDAYHSLNRTLHSVPAFGPPFHSGPNTVPLFRAG